MADGYKTMTLSQCAAYDHETNAKGRLTGWGKVSKDRQERGISRKARLARKQAQAANGGGQ